MQMPLKDVALHPDMALVRTFAAAGLTLVVPE
jgi:hypothetical protein